MLDSVRTVYQRQWPIVEGDPAAELAFGRGLQLLTDIFLDCLVENVEDRLRRGEQAAALRSAHLLRAECPQRWQALVQRQPDILTVPSEVSSRLPVPTSLYARCFFRNRP